VQVKDTKQFWSHLPYQICNNDHVAASPAKDDSCWNGAMKARFVFIYKQGKVLYLIFMENILLLYPNLPSHVLQLVISLGLVTFYQIFT
jgi:hypothetical protein